MMWPLDIQGDARGWWLGERRASRIELGHQAPSTRSPRWGTQRAQALVHKTAGFTFSFQLKNFFFKS